MTPLSLKRQTLLGTWLPWLTLVLVIWLAYVTLVASPYNGFSFRWDTGEILSFTAPPSGLALGDRVQSIGGVSLQAITNDLRLEWYVGAKPGDIIPVMVIRDGQSVTVAHVFPGPTNQEIFQRLNSPLLIAVIFWVAAAITGLAVRPKDTRWVLLIAFLCISAIWLAAATKGSLTHTLYSFYVLRSAAWLSVPIYWHLHWHFPSPLWRAPRWGWPTVYGLFALIAVAEWFGRRDTPYYQFSVVIGLLGSLALLVGQLFRQARMRRDVALLLLMTGISGLAVAAGVVAAQVADQPTYTAQLLPALLLIPVGYLLVINRRKLAGMQWRINRYIGAIAYFTIAVSLLVIVMAVLSTVTGDAADVLAISLLAAGLAATLIVFYVIWGQRFIERRLLGMRLAPEQVLAEFSAQITASLDFDQLAHVLRDTVLPSLLVREAALLRLDEAGAPQPLFLLGVTADQMPTAEQAAELARRSGRYRPPETTASAPCPWVLLPLALTHQGRPIGLWLLGRQDPDDFYAREEIEQLTQLANQAAVALSNSLQSVQLHLLYRRDVDQAELERKRLAQELHDGPMNDLAHLGSRLPTDVSAEIKDGYQAVITELRRIVTNLRPATLNYGLYPALRSLAQEVEDRLGPEQGLELEVEASGERYDPGLEQHVFRIVQQACGNALQHAQPHHIHISGRLESGRLELSVRDDGQGFPDGTAPNLNALLSKHHYGLAGMFERAALVEAVVSVQSTVGSGTQVQVIWPRPAPN